MSSRVAGIVYLLKAAITNPVPQGVTPVPLPNTADFNGIKTAYITVQELTNKDLESLEGPSGLAHTVIQINAWHTDYDQAFEMRRLAKAAIVPGAVVGLDLTIDAVNQVQDTEIYDGVRELHQLINRKSVWWVE